MRKLQIILAAAGFAASLIFTATFSAAAETNGKHASSPQGSAAKESTAQISGEDLSISQGTVTGASHSELDAVQRELAREERLPDYSQVVDNTSDGRFDAQGWKRGATDELAHGGSYAVSATGTEDARFKLKVPTSGGYALYAWWPYKEGNSTVARFGVTTVSGTKWTTVDQTRDGGAWVKIGAYNMRAGDGYSVRVSPGDGSAGRVVADAVVLVRGGETTPPPADLAPADGGPVSAGVSLNSDDVTYQATSLDGRVTGRQLIHFGRKHMGTPYYLSPPAPCWAYVKEDCSCFTRLIFRHFGKSMADSPVTQWQYGHLVRSRSNLRRGDLVFFKESGYSNPITHVGMFAGHGYVLHASSYYGEVVESEMRYMTGYSGAKRIRPRL